jgi:6-phosphogluconolactonase
MKIQTFQKEEEFVKKSIELISKIIKKNPKANIAISGGKTPLPIYKKLKTKKLDFKNINFYQTDERYVPKTHKESNSKMIYEKLIKPLKLKKFHHFYTNLSIKQSLGKYEKEISKVKFDLIILGIGEDGHTASLFPHSDALKETKKQTLHTQTDTNKIKDRLTITFTKILTSKEILVLLKGKNKANIIKELKNPKKDIEEFPAIKLLKHKKLQIFYCTK